MNYLGCQAYFGIISNTAGGYSFYRDARLRRLTRYRYNNVPMDFGGRYIYLRDNASGEFWSPSWQPTRHELEDYSCRHGMGYTDDRFDLRRDRGADALLCAARREPGNLAAHGNQPPLKPGAAFQLSPASSSACGMRRTTPPTSSATSTPARWRSRTASSITRRNTASAAITSRISPARSRSRGSTRSARHFWAPTAAGTSRRPWKPGNLTNSIAHGWSPHRRASGQVRT